MTNITPTQEQALNRAIAEFEGLEFYALFEGTIEYIERVRVFDTEEEQRLHYMLAYTRSLDAIVPVVKKALFEVPNFLPEFETNLVGKVYTTNLIQAASPALALCLAFAKAAGMKGDWE